MHGSRELREVAVGDVLAFREALRAAISGDGPALLPRPAATPARPASVASPAPAPHTAPVPTQPAAAPHREAQAAEDSDRPKLAPHGPFDARLLTTSKGSAHATSVPPHTALVIETSGSTARPKRVMLTGAGLLTAAAATHERLAELRGTEPGGEQWLLCLPAHYIAGAQVLVRSILAGITPAVLQGSFTVESFVRCAATLTGRLRYVSLVPVQLRRLLNAADADPAVAAEIARFDAILVGGQATPPTLLERAATHGWHCVTTYGASETCGGAAYNGRALPGVRIRELAGELLIASDSLALGYLDDPDRTAAAFLDLDGQRWYRTTDAGSVAAGVIRVTGRLDSVIISGGIKVNLDEVAAAANAVGALPVAAVPVASDEWGQRVALIGEDAAVTETTAGEDAVWRPVLTALERFGAAAKPALLLRLPQLPRLASGKPDRRALRELVAAQNITKHQNNPRG